jgi:hypothetical protein
MVEIVNLRQARRRKQREAREHVADENRARHGRSKAEAAHEAAQAALDDARHRAHRRDDDDDG